MLFGSDPVKKALEELEKAHFQDICGILNNLNEDETKAIVGRGDNYKTELPKLVDEMNALIKKGDNMEAIKKVVGQPHLSRVLYENKIMKDFAIQRRDKIEQYYKAIFSEIQNKVEFKPPKRNEGILGPLEDLAVARFHHINSIFKMLDNSEVEYLMSQDGGRYRKEIKELFKIVDKLFTDGVNQLENYEKALEHYRSVPKKVMGTPHLFLILLKNKKIRAFVKQDKKLIEAYYTTLFSSNIGRLK